MRHGGHLMLVAMLIATGCGDDDGGNNANQPDTSVEGVCGDGTLDLGEACDEGAANSDSTPDACRTSCRLPYCGDGVEDASELCDEGAANSDRLSNACRTDCTLPVCGDGVVDGDEACDDGEDNSLTEPGACRPTCELSGCQDGVYDPGDICYRFWDLARLGGMFQAHRVDDDPYPDLVGYHNQATGTFMVLKNTGAGLARGRGYLTPGRPGPPQGLGKVTSGPSQTDFLVGGSTPRLASADTAGRVGLPEVFVAQDYSLGMIDAVTGVTTAGGQRYLTLLTGTSGSHQHCAVPVDASNAPQPTQMHCDPLTALGWNDLQWPETLYTASNQPVLVYLSTYSGYHSANLVTLDGQARVTDATEVVYPSSSEIKQRWIAYPVRGSDQPYWASHSRVEVCSMCGVFGPLLEVRPWDAGGATFGATVSLNATDLYADEESPIRVLFGNFGGTGHWKDLALISSPQGVEEPQISVFLHNGGVGDGYPVPPAQQLQCAGHIPSGRNAIAVDLDNDGDDELVYQDDEYPTSLVVLWNDGGLSCTGLDAFAYQNHADDEGALAQVGHIDGDAFPDLLLLKRGQDGDGEGATYILYGGATPRMEAVGMGSSGSAGLFPRSGDPLTSDLYLLHGMDPYVVGVVRRDAGRWVTGRPLQVVGGEPLAEHTSWSFVTDLDGDSQNDVLIMGSSSTSSVLHSFTGPYSESSEGFVAHRQDPLPYRPGMVILADMDGDDLPEVLTIRSNPIETGSQTDDLITILPNNGGAFDQTPVTVQTAYDPRIIAPGDFNGDGLNDLATAHTTAGMMAVLINDGAGNLTLDEVTGVYITPGEPATLSPIDLDGDGILDLVVSTPLHGMGPIFFRGLGDGTFEEAVDLNLTASEFGVTTGDMDADGFPDLIILKRITEGTQDSWATLVLRATP